MRKYYFILLLLFSTIQNVTAYWDSSTSATVSWYQTERTCLYWQAKDAQPAFIDCYDQPGTYHIELGHVGPLDGTLRPTSGGRYILTNATETLYSPLIAQPQYFPLMTR